MFRFIQEAFGEFEHVVWPTKTETTKYMRYVIGVIVILTIFLSVLGYLFTNSLALSREKVQQAYPSTNFTTTTDTSDLATGQDLNNLIKVTGTTGATQTGITQTGVTLEPVIATGSAQ